MNQNHVTLSNTNFAHLDRKFSASQHSTKFFPCKASISLNTPPTPDTSSGLCSPLGASSHSSSNTHSPRTFCRASYLNTAPTYSRSPGPPAEPSFQQYNAAESSQQRTKINDVQTKLVKSKNYNAMLGCTLDDKNDFKWLGIIFITGRLQE